MNGNFRYFSMFTGVGGFELGIGEKGKCVGFSEIDKYASQLLTNKWPNIRNFGDCTKIIADELPDFDLLVGGFPCQSFSIAGKRRGFDDTRGTMFFEVARIIKVKRPKLVLLENVKGLLNHDKGQTFSVIIQTLEELGYDTQWMVLNSKFFGVPQNRERVFIIGSIRGTPRPEILPFRENDKEVNREIGPFPQEGDCSIWNGNFTKDGNIRCLSGGAHSGGLHSDMTFLHNVYGGFKEGIRESSDTSPTLRTPKGGGHLPMLAEGMKIRRLTPVECERLQGFPDGWTEGFSDTQRYKMMGNAVTVNVIKAIVGRLVVNHGR